MINKLIIFCLGLFSFPYIIYSQDSLPSQTLDVFEFVAQRLYKPEVLSVDNRDFKRLAASFDDPSRILMHYPGLSNANDQANGIIYHGLPSHYSNWQVNGIDVVNPNHLSNAGTLSDISSLAAGGVNMFSGNIIRHYDYRTAIDQKMIGNALAGISDMVIDQPVDPYVQFSLLGLEAGGGITKGKHTFYGNYRYSFTGLLGEMGVNFGNEKIAFTDGVAGYTFRHHKTKFSLFYAGGKSSNIHTPSDDLKETYKDHLQIDYRSNINIVQGEFSTKINEIELQTSIGYSEKNDDRSSKGSIDTIARAINQNNVIGNALWVVHQKIKIKGFEAGIKAIQNHINYRSIDSIGQVAVQAIDSDRWSLLPYAMKSFELGSGFNLGLKAAVTIDKETILLPQAQLTYNVNPNSKFNFSMGRSAQLLAPVQGQVYTKATHANLYYARSGKRLQFMMGMFLHLLQETGASQNYFNTVNTLQLDEIVNISTTEKARSYGGYINADWFLTNRWWINTNLTAFDFTYKDGETQRWTNANNNYRFIGNLNMGKTFVLKRSEINASLSFHYRGGGYQAMPLPLTIPSRQDYNSVPNLALGDYKRIDFRINYLRGRSFWSLDIQNIAGFKNDAFLYYDLSGLVSQKQLGMIPVLSYKRSF